MNAILKKESNLVTSPELLPLEDQAKVDELFAEMINTHNNPHDDFDLLEVEESPDPEQVMNIQSIATVAAIGQSATAKDLVEFGEILVPNLDEYISIMLDRKDLMVHLKDRLEQGDLVVATNHRDVIGVAVALGLTSVCLQENGVRADEFETDIAVSAMLKYVTTRNFPAVQAMQGLFSKTRFVIPAGNKTVRQRLSPEYVEKFNVDSNELLESTSDVPTLRGVAPSGTRDHLTPWRFPGPGQKARNWQMKRPSPNTIKFYFNGPVLGVSLDLSEKPKSGLYISHLHLPDPDVDLATRSEMIMTDLANAKGKPDLKSELI